MSVLAPTPTAELVELGAVELHLFFQLLPRRARHLAAQLLIVPVRQDVFETRDVLASETICTLACLVWAHTQQGERALPPPLRATRGSRANGWDRGGRGPEAPGYG